MLGLLILAPAAACGLWALLRPGPGAIRALGVGIGLLALEAGMAALGVKP